MSGPDPSSPTPELPEEINSPDIPSSPSPVDPPAASPEPPKKIPTPPLVMPLPDLVEPHQVATRHTTITASGERTHPTDPYPPLKQRGYKKGCCSCLGLVILLSLLLFSIVAVTVVYYGPGRYLKKGYQLVQLTDEIVTITEPPDEPTLYLGAGSVQWKVPVTKVPIAILSSTIEVEGDFLEDASLTGVVVTCTSQARFAKDLEVIALEFHESGMTLKGDLHGTTMQTFTTGSLPPSPPGQ